MFGKTKTGKQDIAREPAKKIDRAKKCVCSSCKQELSIGGMMDNFFICPFCGARNRIPARARIELIADEDSFIEHDVAHENNNPIDFPHYVEKVKDAQEKSGENEAVVTGEAEINGVKACVFAMETKFMMASMGSVVGEKIVKLFEYATQKSLPVVGWCASGGARMQEGMVSLMQMAKTSGAAKYHSDAGNFYCSVLTDPTTGGVTASFAMLGDVILAEPKALVGFAGRRVVEQTTHSELPDNFQKAEFQLENGFVDDIVAPEDQKEYLTKLLKYNVNKRAKRGKRS